ncbi:MAG: aminopeptidase [archaeon]
MAMDVQKLAYNIVNKSMRVGKKDNPYFLKISKKYPWMRGAFSLHYAAQNLCMNEKNAEKFLAKYEDVTYGPLLIKKGKRYRVKDKISMTVQVTYHPDNRTLAYAVRDELWKKDAFVIMNETDMERTRKFVQYRSEDALRELPAVSRLIEENIDAAIHLESRDWSGWSRGIPPSKIRVRRPVTMKLHEISDEKHTPWVLVGWPHKRATRERKFPYRKLKKIMFDCIEYSYSSDIQRLVDAYTKAFKGADIIRITADDGTDLSFSLKGRRLNKDTAEYDEEGVKHGDVGKNIPTGEIFFAPVETSANGTLVIPVSVIPGEGVAERLTLTFKDGLVMKSTAEKGAGMLGEFIKKNGKDSNRIAEFGIGLNKKAEFTRGEIIIDEKIFGSVHIAIGWNRGYGGKTNAASHLDFIKDLRNCNGKVFVDGRLVIDKGRLV